MKRIGGVFLAAFLISTAPADAALIGIASGGSGGSGIYSIDPTTGAATLLSITYPPTNSSGATFLGGTFYVSDVCVTDPFCGAVELQDDYALYSINANTGAGTFVSDQDGSDNWHGLASNESGGLIYSIDINDGNKLKALDPTTGIVTTIGTGTADVDGRGMAYDDTNGVLYATGFDRFGVTSLYTIDTTTGAATTIGVLDIGYASDVGLAYDEVLGILYLNNGISRTLYSVNVTTGAVTAIGANGPAWIDGLAWIADTPTTPAPEPTTFALFGLGFATVGLRRRFRRSA